MRSDSFLNRIRFKSIPGLRTLSAVMKGDEAYNWLSLIIKPSRLSNMSHQLIWRLLTLFRNTALSYSFIIIVVIGVGILALKDIFKVDITPILGYMVEGWSTSVTRVILLATMIGVMLIILSIPLTLLFRSNPWIFGWGSFVDTLYLDIYPTKIHRIK